MRRPVLLSVALLGLLVCLIGGAGLFAALTDTARTGTNSVDSAPLAGSADIQLATATPSDPDLVCGSFSENLATAFFTVSDVAPGYQSGPQYFCIRNVGSQSVNVWVSADELTDTDTACTGDEELHGDTTCGGNQLGELSAALGVSYIRFAECTTFSGGSGFSAVLANNAVTPGAFSGTLAPGQTSCFYVGIEYRPTATTTEIQQAQSDLVTWRFKFRADAI